MATEEVTLTDVQKKIFEAITKNDVGELKTLLVQLQGTADFVDENGMTPLQHACYKGSTELVQVLLDQVRSIYTFASKRDNEFEVMHQANFIICCRELMSILVSMLPITLRCTLQPYLETQKFAFVFC